jgi:electron transfer flavoprotein beta subunit
VVDPSVRVSVRSDGSGVDTTLSKMAMNPFDQIAVEEALRLRERGIVTEIVVVSIGPLVTQDVLRLALAMGADRGILVDCPEQLEPLAVARLIKCLVSEESPSLVLLGKQAIDSDAGQTGPMLAGLLGWHQATFASQLEVRARNLVAVREVDGGLQSLQCMLPAVVTTDLRLNEPRFASLPNIMRARSKPLTVRPVGTFGVDLTPCLDVVSTRPFPARKRGRTLESATELAAILKTQLS